jgi:hypothetical protein
VGLARATFFHNRRKKKKLRMVPVENPVECVEMLTLGGEKLWKTMGSVTFYYNLPVENHRFCLWKSLRSIAAQGM